MTNLGTLVVDVVVKGEKAKAQMNSVAKSTRRAGTGFRLLASIMRAAGGQLASATIYAAGLTGGLIGLAVAVGGLVLVLKKSIKVGAQFESSVIRASLALDTFSVENVNALRDSIRGLAASSKFTGDEMAKAAQKWIQAGRDLDDFRNFAGEAAIDLAAVAGINPAQGLEISMRIMNQYGMTAKDLTKINDILVGTFSTSTATIPQLGQAFKYVGATAASAGVSLEETAASIGLLTDLGLEAGMAGRGLNNAILAMIKPTEKAKKTLKSLNIVVDKELQGSVVKMVAAFADAGANLKDLSEIFDKRALRTMAPMVMAFRNLGKEGRTLADRMLQVAKKGRGIARVMRLIEQQSPESQWKVLISKLTELGNTIFQEARPELMYLLKGLINVAEGAVGMAKSLGQGLRQVIRFGLGVKAVIEMIDHFVDMPDWVGWAVDETVKSLKNLVPGLDQSVAGIKTLGKMFNWVADQAPDIEDPWAHWEKRLKQLKKEAKENTLEFELLKEQLDEMRLRLGEERKIVSDEDREALEEAAKNAEKLQEAMNKLFSEDLFAFELAMAMPDMPTTFSELENALVKAGALWQQLLSDATKYAMSDDDLFYAQLELDMRLKGPLEQQISKAFAGVTDLNDLEDVVEKIARLLDLVGLDPGEGQLGEYFKNLSSMAASDQEEILQFARESALLEAEKYGLNVEALEGITDVVKLTEEVQKQIADQLKNIEGRAYSITSAVARGSVGSLLLGQGGQMAGAAVGTAIGGPMGGAIGGGIGQALGEVFGSSLDDLIESLEVLRPLFDIVGDAFRTLTPALTFIRDILEALAPAISAIIDLFLSLVYVAFAPFIAALIPLLPIVMALAEAIEWLAEVITKYVVKPIIDAINGFISALNSIFKMIDRGVQAATGGLLDFSFRITRISMAANGLANSFQNFDQMLEYAGIAQLERKRRELVLMAGILHTMGQLSRSQTDSIHDMIVAIDEEIEERNKATESLKEFNEEVNNLPSGYKRLKMRQLQVTRGELGPNPGPARPTTGDGIWRDVSRRESLGGRPSFDTLRRFNGIFAGATGEQ